jgi:hypothetical protein
MVHGGDCRLPSPLVFGCLADKAPWDFRQFSVAIELVANALVERAGHQLERFTNRRQGRGFLGLLAHV